MNINSIAGNNMYLPIGGILPQIGCDLPQDGGITGNYGLRNKPIPGAMEERPVMTDPITGEKIYEDQWLLQQAQRSGAKFSTTA